MPGVALVPPDALTVFALVPHHIGQANTLDLTLDDIKDVLVLQPDEQPCERVPAMRDAHIAEIDRTPADPRRRRRPPAAAVCQNIDNPRPAAEPVRT